MSSGDALAAGDVAAIWDVKLPDGKHKVVFEHGTTSGKRVIFVDDREASSQLRPAESLATCIAWA